MAVLSCDSVGFQDAVFAVCWLPACDCCEGRPRSSSESSSLGGLLSRRLRRLLAICGLLDAVIPQLSHYIPLTQDLTPPTNPIVYPVIKSLPDTPVAALTSAPGDLGPPWIDDAPDGLVGSVPL